MISNPFTPKSGLEPRIFMNRNEETQFFMNKLHEMAYKPADHYVIQGDWGIGKTVLLKELKRRAQMNGCRAGYIKIPKFPENSSLLDTTIHLVRSLTRALVVDPGMLKKAHEKIQSLGIQIMGTGFQVSKKQQLIDPQSFLIESLLELHHFLKNESTTIPIFVDDVQNYELISEMLTLYLNVLSDDDIAETKYLFILSTTTAGWKQFLKKHHPIGRYFSAGQILRSFTRQDTINLVHNTLTGTNVRFDESVVAAIYEYTQGHPYEVQVLCSNLYESQMRGKVGKKEWVIGLRHALMTLGESVFEEQIARASKDEYIILKELATYKTERTLKEISAHLPDKRISYEAVSTFLGRLTEKELVKRVSRGTYVIPDKLLQTYILFRDE